MNARPPHIRIVVPLSSAARVEWEPEVAARVAAYKARRDDRAFRQAQAAARARLDAWLEPSSRESGDAARPSRVALSPCTVLSAASLRHLRVLVWSVGLAFCAGLWGGLGWLAWTRPVMTAGTGLAVGAAMLIVAVLRAWDEL